MKAPSLILWGAQDKIIPPAYAYALQARLPNSQVRAVEGAGHLLMLEQPDQFADHVTTFLKA